MAGGREARRSWASSQAPASGDAEQVHDEHERLVGSDDAAGAALAVGRASAGS